MVGASIAIVAAGCGGGGAGARMEPDAAAERYRSYLEERAASLRTAVSQLVSKIRVGYVGGAQSRYVYARVSLGQLQPAMSALGVDLRGFRRIEQALWKEETNDGMLPLASQLLDDVQGLQDSLKTVVLRPSRMVDGASTALGEIVDSKIAGESAPFSYMGMVDVSANVEGAEAAFEAVRPELDGQGPRLADEIEVQFRTVFAELRRYGQPARDPKQTWPSQPGISFSPYDPSPAEARQTARPFRRLARLFSRIPGRDAKANFIRKADAICRSSREKIVREGLVLVRSATGDEALRRRLEGTGVSRVLIPTLEEEVEELGELAPPAADRDEIEAILDATREVIDEAKTDPQTFIQASGQYTFGHYRRAARLAADYGLPSCPQG